MSTPKGDAYVVLYAGVVCMLCGLLLAVASSALKKPQEYNKEIDRKTNVLKAFGVPVIENGKRIKPDRVEQYFKESVSELVVDGASGQAVATAAQAGQPLPLYTWSENGLVTKYAFPISGKGLWSTIKGYLALEKDLSTLAGVTFYEHGETPGLGGEVETDWFQQNFRGKSVVANGRRVKFEVADRYPQGNDHAVDGISGATLTGNGVTRFINADLDKYEKYLSALRKG
jgi:Na+-transporting NADH:ubiquinone oxidoreductase subunit C